MAKSKRISNVSRGNIIWALDPTQDPQGSKELVKQLKLWAQVLGCKVQPVSIFPQSLLDLQLERLFMAKGGFEELANAAVKSFLKKVGAVDFLSPELIFIKSNSARKMAKTLVERADRTQAPLIFALTRGQTSWNPFRLGGFTETLLAVSNTPLLLLSPLAKSRDEISNVLYPTDFNPESKQVMVQVLPWIKTFKAKFTLLNLVERLDMYPSEFDSKMQARIISVEKALLEIETKRIKKAKIWSEFLTSKGLEVGTVIERQDSAPGKAIIDAAKDAQADLIAMPTYSGTLTQRLIGSVARDVLMQSDCPVLIVHHEVKRRRPNRIRRLAKHSRGTASQSLTH